MILIYHAILLKEKKMCKMYKIYFLRMLIKKVEKWIVNESLVMEFQ